MRERRSASSPGGTRTVRGATWYLSTKAFTRCENSSGEVRKRLVGLFCSATKIHEPLRPIRRIAWQTSTHMKNRLSPGMRRSHPATGGSNTVPAITHLLPQRSDRCRPGSPRDHPPHGAERRGGEVGVVLDLP